MLYKQSPNFITKLRAQVPNFTLNTDSKTSTKSLVLSPTINKPYSLPYLQIKTLKITPSMNYQVMVMTYPAIILDVPQAKFLSELKGPPKNHM